MGQFDYQRTVIAYHGCDETVVEDVLLKGKPLSPSKNDYDWLGDGIYFWEHGPQRALEWASSRKNISNPSVIGAVLHLGDCFDLLDVLSTQHLSDAFPRFVKACEKEGRPIPGNTSDGKHYLDCAVINWTIDWLEKETKRHVNSVRCIFTEGGWVFKDSKIMLKSHIQIAIRDPAVIVGYFKPKY